MSQLFSLDMVYGGGLAANLVCHLTSTPLVQPYALASMVESSWPGYTPFPASKVAQQTATDNYQFLEIQAFFGNNTDQSQIVTGLWVDADIQGELTLAAVLDGAFVELPACPPGGAWYQVVLSAFRPGGP